MKYLVVQSSFVRSISIDGDKAKSYLKLLVDESDKYHIMYMSYFLTKKESPELQTVKKFKDCYLLMSRISFKQETLNRLTEKFNNS